MITFLIVGDDAERWGRLDVRLTQADADRLERYRKSKEDDPSLG